MLWQRANTQNIIFLNLINSTDNTKLSWYTLPPRQYHSFLRNLYPLYSFIIIKSQLELKTTTNNNNKNNNNNNKNHHDSQRLTKCDPPYDFGDKDENSHNTSTHCADCITLKSGCIPYSVVRFCAWGKNFLLWTLYNFHYGHYAVELFLTLVRIKEYFYLFNMNFW